MDNGSKLRKHIWDSMLTVDLSCRYYSRLVGRFQSQDRWAKVFIAITSSTVVSGWAIWGQPGLDWIWKAASGGAAIVSIALPIWNPANSLKTASKLAAVCFSILKDYELLWTQVDSMSEAEARKACQKIQLEEKRLAELEPQLPKNRRLAKLCEDEVRRFRGEPQ